MARACSRTGKRSTTLPMSILALLALALEYWRPTCSRSGGSLRGGGGGSGTHASSATPACLAQYLAFLRACCRESMRDCFSASVFICEGNISGALPWVRRSVRRQSGQRRSGGVGFGGRGGGGGGGGRGGGGGGCRGGGGDSPLPGGGGDRPLRFLFRGARPSPRLAASFLTSTLRTPCFPFAR